MLDYIYAKHIRNIKKGKLSKGGRNFLGRVCVKGRSFLHKKKLFKLDLCRRINQFGIVFKLLYDYNRTGKIGLIYYRNGLMCALLLTEGFFLGQKLYSGSNLNANEKIKVGYSLPLYFMPLFSLLSNIELKEGQGGRLVRAGGTSALYIGKTKTHGILKLKSGWEIKLNLSCMSTLGVVYSRLKKNFNYCKAGKKRERGFKSKVRGVAQNPCDHAHGGGNGKRSKPKVAVNANVTCFKWRPTTNKIKDRLRRRKFKKLI